MPKKDAAWYDAQFDNRARVPGHPVILERWARASELSRDSMSRRLDVTYGEGPNEVLDIFPTTRADAPVLVFIHGEGWRAIDKRRHSFVAPVFVNAGAMVVVPSYQPCPANSIEGIALQMVKALAWVWRNAALYGGDPDRIVVAGHSAGAHLAAMLLCCDWKSVGRDLPSRLVSKVLAISGVYDLDGIRRTSFLQPDLRLTPASVRKLSPAGFAAPKGTLCAVAGADESEEFQCQTALIQERWGRKVVPVSELLPGVDHFNILHELVDPDARLCGLAKELLGIV